MPNSSFSNTFWYLAAAFILGSLLSATPAKAMEPGLSDEFEQVLRQPFKGDFDEIVDRGFLRVLVPFSKTAYFIDGGVQRGTAVDLMTELGKFLDKKHGKKVRDGQLVMIPTPRADLFSDLEDGQGDIALGNLTVTPERLQLVDFSTPLFKGAKEVPLTAEGATDLTSPEALSGLSVHVRRSSSYFNSLLVLNERLEADGKPLVDIVPADENLEDEDLIELVKAGSIPMIIIDEHKADFWMQVIDGLQTHPDAAVRTDGNIAIAVRKNAPSLLKEINGFVKIVEKGTLLGNIILKRYFQDTKFLKNLNDGNRQEQLLKIEALFKKYGQEYNIDWLLIAAQSYQESQFKQEVRSHAGAVGLMQIKPSTAAGNPINIKGVAADADNNVHAGVKYLRYLADQYFADLEHDRPNQTFFALAAYNAGPSRFKKLRAEAEKSGYDPNKWFGNVEWIVSKRISREPVRYVGNIYKYYVVFAKELQRYDQKNGAATDSK
ncbi:lytic transglycosylase F [Labrenzia sp. PHM005]|uniref:transglycosylase SLT domain-containing protein n=1 Tax=Labrenzia sp. PHM005 TaxID=2590016 RepID=UPI00143DF28F|nr:lytic transglycosylase F [Labrenzia sp. PHM005]